MTGTGESDVVGETGGRACLRGQEDGEDTLRGKVTGAGAGMVGTGTMAKSEEVGVSSALLESAAVQVVAVMEDAGDVEKRLTVGMWVSNTPTQVLGMVERSTEIGTCRRQGVDESRGASTTPTRVAARVHSSRRAVRPSMSPSCGMRRRWLEGEREAPDC